MLFQVIDVLFTFLFVCFMFLQIIQAFILKFVFRLGHIAQNVNSAVKNWLWKQLNLKTPKIALKILTLTLTGFSDLSIHIAEV